MRPAQGERRAPRQEAVISHIRRNTFNWRVSVNLKYMSKLVFIYFFLYSNYFEASLNLLNLNFSLFNGY